MADRVRYNLDKLAPLFKQLEQSQIFTHVSHTFFLFLITFALLLTFVDTIGRSQAHRQEENRLRISHYAF